MSDNENKVMVSVNCITYNHERYIEEAIESFIMQKTNFVYEILIHDDCSTDNTPSIIKKYEEKYPELIKVIYEKDNQYSKGNKLIPLNEKIARGKYVAFCEGDDYWTDPYKLQKQVDFMEQHTEYSMCTHSALSVDASGKDLNMIVRPSIDNKEFNIEEIIIKDGSLFPSNSMLYRLASVKDRPEFYLNAPVEDYPLAIYCALKGKVYNFDEVMSAYRVEAKGSWSEKMMNNIQYFVAQKRKLILMLQELDVYTNYEFHNTIHNRIFLMHVGKAQRLAETTSMLKRLRYLFDCNELNVVEKVKYWTILFFFKQYSYVKKKEIR